ncbi:AcrR family transcriptional regulator [Streptomyces sp. SAI-135]|jgi:TetR/AcrR family transcriptional repressor for divergent bdcA|uniref:TetR/AcrR family transcriptional regulator n=1 Tax=unclassified Streptomyces TaxID=2593676 RepID=UPI002473DB96|nr:MULTISPECIES: TetR/AcrR family transcriptional regulator [unclassified Streptomyces]MDH6522765.1 AcrR family transcriptional regulator [Streptomyces sp. SAI-090]MDH6554386.1 AcrR family transcriptional regulator [Streptomyces sp. SAI-041]MDH6573652.1 AcrR family transcriptional regulator [Streptomyces sp. SAI-117]MDH6581615.1 AcrR family transcriptional regulator [Streptomyces sp. SAI-133]MDH6613620.1 AcrR family transcriptional regulator [Streptomyces sp. SAI-135]
MDGTNETVRRGRGRPRKFERKPALETAVRVFWQQGYEATGVAELREAMGGMPSASFYQLFGSKAELFTESIAHYRATYGRVLDPLTDASLDPKEAIRQTLSRSIAMQTDKEHPLGCMMVLAAPISDTDDPVYAMVAERRHITRSRVLDRVRQAIAEGALPPGTDAEAMAGLIYGFLMGISTQARDGVPAETMQRSADALLALWGQPDEPDVAESRGR